jgi:hypothetical protein
MQWNHEVAPFYQYFEMARLAGHAFLIMQVYERLEVEGIPV